MFLKEERLFEYLFSLYFFGILFSTLIAYSFFPAITSHGRNIKEIKSKPFPWLLVYLHAKRISKKYYFIFYSLPSLVYLIYILFKYKKDTGIQNLSFVIYSPILLHSLRRMIETLVYWNCINSKMTLLQFTHAFIYFTLLPIYMIIIRLKVPLFTFIIINVFQIVAHYRAYALKTGEITHYIAEACIFLYIFYCYMSLSLGLNAIYVIIFVMVSIKERVLNKSKRQD